MIRDAVAVRRAGPADAQLLAQLHALCFPDAWTAAFLVMLLGQPSVRGLLLRTGDEPVGFILARTAAGETEILTLAVRPTHRRRRSGYRLCLALLAELREAEVRELFLEVAEDNEAALGLYAQLGFAPIGRRPNYYSDTRQNALLLRLTLG